MSSRSRGVIAFTVPCVPTGMKTGVSIVPCGGRQHAAPRGAVAVGDGEGEEVRLGGEPTVAGEPWGRLIAVIIPIVKKLRVGVIYGGRSGEHEVSVASAASIIKHLDRTRYEPCRSASRKTAAGPSPTGRRRRSRRPK